RPRFATSSPRPLGDHTSAWRCWLPRKKSAASKNCRSQRVMTSHGRWISSDRPRHERHSEIFRPLPEARVVDWLASLTGDVAITSVTLAELLAGARRLPDGRRKAELTRLIGSALEPYRGSRSLLPFDEAAAECYVGVLVAREAAGAPISTADAQIAAI